MLNYVCLICHLYWYKVINIKCLVAEQAVYC